MMLNQSRVATGTAASINNKHNVEKTIPLTNMRVIVHLYGKYVTLLAKSIYINLFVGLFVCLFEIANLFCLKLERHETRHVGPLGMRVLIRTDF